MAHSKVATGRKSLSPKQPETADLHVFLAKHYQKDKKTKNTTGQRKERRPLDLWYSLCSHLFPTYKEYMQ